MVKLSKDGRTIERDKPERVAQLKASGWVEVAEKPAAPAPTVPKQRKPAKKSKKAEETETD